MITGLVSNIQRYSLQDGPGIRTTVFLKGCPLSCAWCHNPENLSRLPQVVVFEARCVRCGACLEACPKALAGGADFAKAITAHNIPGSQCTRCGACVEACPTGAREMLGRASSVEEVLTEIRADQVFFEESGGGATFSGGEPLSQFEFLHAALTACRQHGIHMTVDTCGFAPREHLLAIAALTDLFLYDLKFMDDVRHQEFCGVSNQLILENLRELSRVHRRIWIRIPVIPGVNDLPKELDAMAEYIRSLSSIQQVNLLPYHRTGIHKFERVNREYALPHIVPPSSEYMDAIAARFSAAGLTTKIGG